jgi:predicted amidohydrolase
MSTSSGIPIHGSLAPSPSSHHLNLALAQIEALPADSSPEPDSPSSSSSSALDKLSQITAQAASHGADVVVFPEYFLTGSTHDEWRKVREEGGPVKPAGLEKVRLHLICENTKQLTIRGATPPGARH